MLFLVLLVVFGVAFGAPGYFFYGPPTHEKLFWYNNEPLQRQMTFQYHPQWMHHLSSTSDGGVSAFVAGNSGSTGSVLESLPPLQEASTANVEQYSVEADAEVSSAPEVTTKASKKIQILPESDEEHDEADFEERRRSSSGPMIFPLRFGSTNGAAIAIANSYSPGRGGSAVSHATAYGNPMMDSKKPRQIP